MNILITSDDGYRSAGVRILVNVLKDKHNLKIAATDSQQSSVGAKLTVKGGKWGIGEVNGVEALWVDGTPADAVECAKSYYKDIKFDLCTSGINYGQNVASELVSGTISAAVRSVANGLVERSIAFSMEIHQRHWLDDSTEHDIEELVLYPGQQASKIIDKAFENDFWGAQILNVNFPLNMTDKIKFTKPYPYNYKVYGGGADLYSKDGHYQYIGRQKSELGDDQSFDAVALREGFITLNLLKPNLENEQQSQKYIGNIIEI